MLKMNTNKKLKEIDIKNCTFCYFEYIKNHMKMFQYMKLHTKFHMVQNLYVLFSIY